MTAKGYGTRAENELRAILQAKGYLVIRSAASKCLDLVCVRPGIVYGLEVKATHGNVYYSSRNPDSKEQREELINIRETYDLKTLYAVRFLSGWEVFDPYQTIMRRGCGQPLDEAFPILRSIAVSPNIPPIVPRELTGEEIERCANAMNLPPSYVAPRCGDDRDGQGGGTE